MSDPTREEVDRMEGPVVIEFGAPWCGHCQAIQDHLAGLLSQYPEIRHIDIHDGPGKRLGRSFRVKLWPTLVFLRDGQCSCVTVKWYGRKSDPHLTKSPTHLTN